MANEKKITRENWVSSFTLVGRPKVNDFTFKIDQQSQKSNWIYNSMNLGIDCGEKHGVVYAEIMSGYSPERENVIYAHGKDANGNDDFKAQVKVDWEDRFDEEIIESLGDMSFFTVGIEKTDKGKTYVKKFLSAYDAIPYIEEHLTSDMVVNVRGQIKYSMYNDTVQIRKEIQSIFLSNKEEDEFSARFTQSILLDKDSASLKNIDKDKGVMYVDARVLDYVKEYKGTEIRGQFPFSTQFEFELDLKNQELCKKVYDKLFKVKKDITQITFDGIFVTGGATVQATMDDLPDDIRDLIGLVYTEEQALALCSTNGSREQRMILVKPYIKLIGEEKTPELQRFERQYTEEDLMFDIADEDDDEDVPFEEDVASEEDSSEEGGEFDWLNELDD